MRCRTRVKFCGMTRAEDIVQAVALGADAIGLIFYTNSSRYIDVGQAQLLFKNIPAFVDTVAVFVNPTISHVQHVIAKLPVQYLQFHGDESPEFCEQFKIPYIKAVQATSTDAIRLLVQQHKQAVAVLLDTPSAITRGGRGVTFDWEIIPRNLEKPIILAGGLNASNVCAAVATCAPFAVDLCTGIEASPGIKDSKKMKEFVNSLEICKS